MRFSRALALVPLSLLALAGCSDDGTGPRSPASLQIVSGDGQQAFAGATLAEPLVVRVNDSDGQPLGGVRVTWTVTSGGGSVTPTTTNTNSNGLAQAQWTLGDATGAQAVSATVGTLAPAVFEVQASAAFADPACFGNAHALAVGQTMTFTGSAASEFCVSAGVGGGEYVAVAHLADLATDTIRLQARGVVGGAVADVADVAPAVSFGRAAVRGAVRPLDGLMNRRRDVRFHDALRRRERSLTPMIPAARAALQERGELGGLTPSFAIGTSSPEVGQIVTINAQANSACTNPIDKQGRIAAVGQYAVIVHDTENPSGGFTDAEYASIAATFDTLIHPLAVENFGAPSDIDANGRAFIFYTAEVNKLTEPGSGSYIGGFYFVRDLFPKTARDGLQGCATSNEAEIFYMLVPDPNAQLGDKREKDFVLRVTLGTIAHEYQHLINASRRMFVNDASAFEQTWLDEGLAHIAEELTFYESARIAPGGNLDLDDLRNDPVVLEAFNRFGINNLFRFEDFIEAPSANSPYNANDQLSTRGSAWHFLRYVADRRGGNQQAFWYNLVNSTSTGLTNLEFALGSSVFPWARDWATTVLTDDHVSGVDATLTQPSWNLRSIFTAQTRNSQGQLVNLFSGGQYSLATVSLGSETPVTRTLIGGGAAYLSLSLGSSAAAAYQIRADGGAPPSDLTVTLVRTR